MYDGFVGALDERESRGEQVESSFVGINKADIIEAELKRRRWRRLRSSSSASSSPRPATRKGKVIEGDPKKVREVTDIWTFARDVSSRDPNWKLVATEAAN